MEAHERLIERLLAIAGKNDDDFRFRIDILPMRQPGTIRYSLVAEETADGHCFVSGLGMSFEEAAIAAEKHIPMALQTWGYKE